MDVTLQQILNARELRAQTQRALLAKYQKPLLCFTMNIAGPEKCNRDISLGFSVGNWLLKDALRRQKVLHFEQRREPTGCEAFYVVDMPARELKLLAVDLEDGESFGRLFDMDVLDADGKKLERRSLGLPQRSCLLCEQDAAICARSRRHSVSELQDRTAFLLYLAARQSLTEYIASRAYFALNEEVCTTPKPGLVDRSNQGAHPDMTVRHFFASANALRPFFSRFAEEGFLTRDLPARETFRRIRPIGKEAEQAMFRATRGVNTHKGAIFSLGLLCAAAGRICPDAWQPQRLLAECGAMTQDLIATDLENITGDTAQTTGEKLYAEYGITGIRGQAQTGFPAVRDVGLPMLEQGLNKGLSFNDAGCVTLLHLMAATDDTNLIHRSSRQTQLEIRTQLAALLEQDPFPTLERIRELDRTFIGKNLSPGGSADLLAMTYLLYFLKQ